MNRTPSMGQPAQDTAAAEELKFLAFGIVAEEIHASLCRGEQPDIQDLIDRYPDMELEIRQLVPAIAGLWQLEAEASWRRDSPTPHETEPDRTLGDFRIQYEIGRGGMGVVYLAEQISLHRQVALKVLPFAAVLDQRQLRRFNNEALAAAQLKHPNIVCVHGVGCERGVHFYAMEYVEGQTLAEAIHDLRVQEGLDKKERPATLSKLSQVFESNGSPAAERSFDDERYTDFVPTQADASSAPETKRMPQAGISTEHSIKSPAYFRSVAAMGIQVAKALQHAHDEGVLHRDIKPSNLILDDQGKIWVTDFGLARIEANPGLTLTGDIVGTLRYMSPEQALAKRVIVDHRADIYSLCATLFEMVTLEPVFAGADRQELIKQIALEEPRQPRKLNRTVPSELETIILKGIEKDPRQRYQTAEELSDDLRRFLEEKPILAKSPTLAKRVVKWSRRHPSVVASVLATLLVVVVATTASAVLLTREARLVKAEWMRAERAEVAATRAAATAKTINRFLTEYVLTKADPQNLDDASLFADRWFPDEPQLKGVLYQTIGKLYGRLGEFDKSETHYRAAIELLRPSGGEDPETLETMNGLGYTLDRLGRSDEAERLLRESLQTSRAALGDESPTTLGAMQNLALVLLGRDRLPEAEVFAQQNWDTRQRLLGSNHPDTAIAAVHFSKVLSAAGKVAAADELLSPAVDVLRQRRGTEDPDTLTAMRQLAATHERRGELDSAEALLRQILQARIVVQGTTHSLTLAAMSDLADLLKVQDHLPEAESLFKQILQAKQREFGGEHAETLVAVDCLADVFWEQGKLQEAVDVYGQIRTAAPSQFQAGPDALQIANKYGIVLQGLGKYAEAEQLFRDNWNVARRTLGVEHSTAQVSLVRLIISLYAQRKIWDAEPLARENYLLFWRIPDDSIANTTTGLPEAIAMTNFAYRRSNQKTVSLLRDSLRHKRETLPPDHLSIATTLAVLGRDLLANKNFDESEELLRESLTIRRKALPAGNWLLAETESLLGSCLTQLSLFDEAQLLLEESYQTIADSPELEAPLKLELLQRIVTLYDRWQRPAQSSRLLPKLEELLRRCIHDYESLLPENHTLVLDTRSRLGECLTALGRHRDAELLLLSAYAAQGVAISWDQDPYSSGSHAYESLRRIVELYDSSQRPDEALPWRELELLHSEDESLATDECHRKGIDIWERISASDSNPPHQFRLSRAYSDLGLALLQTDAAAESRVWFENACERLADVLAVDDWNVPAREQLAACHLGLADAYVLQAKYAQAQVKFEQAAEIALRLHQEGRAESIPESRGAFAVSRDAPGRLALFLANCPDPAFRDLKRALQLAQEAHARAPKSYANLLALGLAHYRTGNLKATIELLNPSQHSGSPLLLAMAYWKLGDHEGGRFHYNAVARKRAAARQSSSSSRIWWLRLAVNQLFDEASELLGVEEIEEQAIEAHELGLSLARDGDLDEAIIALRSAIELKVNYPEAHFDLASCLNKKGDLDATVVALREAIKLKPDYAKAYYNLGTVQGPRGNLDKAIDAFRKAIELEPDYWSAQCNLGYALELKGEFAAAVDAFERTIKLQPDTAKYYDHLASLRATCSDPEVRNAAKAVKLASKATQLAPTVGSYWYTLGGAAIQAGAFTSAVDAYREAAELQPDDAQTQNALAWLLATCRDRAVRNPVQAVKSAMKATELAPNEGGFWNTLGVSRYRTGNHTEAVTALRRSIELRKGGDSFDFFFLAMAYRKLGKPDQADDWYSKALAWMQRHGADNEDLRQFREEAAELLSVSGATRD